MLKFHTQQKIFHYFVNSHAKDTQKLIQKSQAMRIKV